MFTCLCILCLTDGPDDLLLKMLNRAPTELPVFYSLKSVLENQSEGRIIERSRDEPLVSHSDCMPLISI